MKKLFECSMIAAVLSLLVYQIMPAQAQVATQISLSAGVDCHNVPIPANLPQTVAVSGAVTTITINGGLNWVQTTTVSGGITTISQWVPNGGC